MTMVGTQVPELTDEHADGTIWADVQGDIWQPGPFGWITLRHLPFAIATEVGVRPGPVYGPYLAVIGPPEGREPC
jgi:hypothetical protein